jgi:hypothetical protein
MNVKPSLLSRVLSPKTEIGFNVGGDLIQIKKTFLGITWLRVITDPNVADNVIDRWVEYGDWSIV